MVTFHFNPSCHSGLIRAGHDHPFADPDSEIITKDEVELPRKFKVLLHNDDYTTMEFVVLVLKRIFHKPEPEAEQIMLRVHQEGVGICGVYTFEIAESKMNHVIRFAKDNGHPLKCTIEPE